MQGAADFLLDVVGFKQRAFAFKQLLFCPMHRGRIARRSGSCGGGFRLNRPGFLRVEAGTCRATRAGLAANPLIKQGFRRLDFCLFLNVPTLGQVVDVGLKLLVGGIFGGVGADDVAVTRVFGQQVGQAFAQAVSFGIVLDALGNTDVVFLRKVDEETPGQRDLSGKARAFGVNWSLMTCTKTDCPSNSMRSIRWVSSGCGVVREHRRCAETRAFQTDVDERACMLATRGAPRPDKYYRPDYGRCCVRMCSLADIVSSSTATRVSCGGDVDEHGFGRTDGVLRVGILKA